MKKVTAFVGCANRRYTYRAVEQFLKNLQALGDVECEIVSLNDYQLETCRGCQLCFNKGEEYCPLHDDRDALIKKIRDSDGIVLASPNYSFHVSGLMKTFLDRLGFVFHRPQFHGRLLTSIVCQGIYGGNKIVKYFDLVGRGLGFNTVKGSCLRTLHPLTEKAQQRIDRKLAGQSRQYYKALLKSAFPTPTMMSLFAFRMSRTSMKLMRGACPRDYAYYSKEGWFESGYYYPARMGALKKAAGHLFDSLAVRIAGNGNKDQAAIDTSAA